jgi:hypothetical protein
VGGGGGEGGDWVCMDVIGGDKLLFILVGCDYSVIYRVKCFCKVII